MCRTDSSFSTPRHPLVRALRRLRMHFTLGAARAVVCLRLGCCGRSDIKTSQMNATGETNEATQATLRQESHLDREQPLPSRQDPPADTKAPSRDRLADFESVITSM